MRCNKGIDHGLGISAWMHPPVHRLLGWVSKPSALKMSRNVWRLNQIRAIVDKEVFVKGDPAITDPVMIDRFPTLLDAYLLNLKGEKLGIIADLFFDSKTGNILHYLVSRSDPRIPGSSRWCLMVDRIVDQEPGIISSNLTSLDDLPILKSSVRQEFMRKSRIFRDQIQKISDNATDKLEGWLEELPFDESTESKDDFIEEEDPLNGWPDKTSSPNYDNSARRRYKRRNSDNLDNNDLWF